MITRLIIELRDDGKVYVNGPLDTKKDLCIAMLDEAKDAIRNYQRTQIIIPELKKIIK